MQNDPAAMARELSAMSSSSPEMAALALNIGAGTEAYFGRAEKARALVQRRKEQAGKTGPLPL